MSSARVLVVDDEDYVREGLAELLELEGFHVSGASSYQEASERLRQGLVDVLVTDLCMPQQGGLALVRACVERERPLPVIVISGAATIPEAVEAMKSGAFDLLQKPVDFGELLERLGKALEQAAADARAGSAAGGAEAGRAARRAAKVGGLAGSSAQMRHVLAQIDRVAPTDAVVLLHGESGTGKELAAREIHARSARAAGPLVSVNCAAIPAELFESELFGHRRGSFTGATADRKGRFEEAEGGTLVLDEIGTLQPAMQSKLLRVLDAYEYQRIGDSATRVADARIVAITNEDLAARARDASFRADLFYRLNVFPIEMPALRDRKEDIPELATAVLGALRARRKMPAESLDDSVLAVLAEHDWPGNVRELKNVLERAVILASPRAVDAALVRQILEAARSDPAAVAREAGLHLRKNLDALGRELIVDALARTGGRKKEAAALLGIDARNLGYYLRKHGIQDPRAGR